MNQVNIQNGILLIYFKYVGSEIFLQLRKRTIEIFKYICSNELSIKRITLEYRIIWFVTFIATYLESIQLFTGVLLLIYSLVSRFL